MHVSPHVVDEISIHAPREGCDPRITEILHGFFGISIHAPREGCDVLDNTNTEHKDQFQSTHPVRGATGQAEVVRRQAGHFNPRTP